MSALLAIFLLAQQGIGIVTNDCTGQMFIRWANAPLCVQVEGSADAMQWEWMYRLQRKEGPHSFEYPIPTNGPMTFYRLSQWGCP